MNVAVSIVIPCYNPTEDLFETLASVEVLDTELCEIILVDDGSPDAAGQAILSEVEKKHRVIRKENGGVGSARNAGIRASAGRYVLPLDQDNRILADFVYDGTSIMDAEPDVAVVYGKRAFIGPGAKAGRVQAGEFDIARLLVGNYIDACALFRKSVAEEAGYFPEDLPIQGLEDWELWLSIAERGGAFRFLDRVTYEYRIQNESMSTDLLSGQNLERNIEFVLRRHVELYRRVFNEQYQEVVNRRSWVPYSIRKAARRIFKRNAS